MTDANTPYRIAEVATIQVFFQSRLGRVRTTPLTLLIKKSEHVTTRVTPLFPSVSHVSMDDSFVRHALIQNHPDEVESQPGTFSATSQ